MNPYYNYKYLYDRIAKITPAAQPMPQQMPVIQPAPQVMPALQPEVTAPVQSQPSMPITPPMQPVAPVEQPVEQPMMPIEQPMMPNFAPQPYPMMPTAPLMQGNMMSSDMYTMPSGDYWQGTEMGVGFGRPEDPPPHLSDRAPVIRVSAFKELTGFPSYGNPSNNADILYTGNRGTWTFDLIPALPGLGLRTGVLVIRAVLDDHYNVPVNRYSARITVNGTTVHDGRVPLEHGTPAGGRFNNWRDLTFNINNLRRNNRIVIVNTSNTGTDDWIGLDWMEIRIAPQ